MVNKIFVPSKRFGFILGSILLFVLIIAFLNFPFEMFSMTSLDYEAKFSVGWPVTFFEVDILNVNFMPIRWGAFILSFVGYVSVSYALDVFISFIFFQIGRPRKPEEILTQARKAYFYYKSQGKSESEIKDLFKKKGWKEEDIDKLR
jgi:hypothetical protein